MDIAKSTALVTGGTRGIGLAIADELKAAGATVYVTGRRRRSEPTVGEMICVDHSLKGSSDQIVRWFRDRGLSLNILINNAGVQHRCSLLDPTSCELIENEVVTNLLSPIRLTMSLLPLLQEHSVSSIVNITSALAITPKESAPGYCATKAALSSFSRSLSYQLEGSGVNILEVLPPRVETDMTRESGGEMLSPKSVAELIVLSLAADKTEPIYPGGAELLKDLYFKDPNAAAEVVRLM